MRTTPYPNQQGVRNLCLAVVEQSCTDYRNNLSLIRRIGVKIGNNEYKKDLKEKKIFELSKLRQENEYILKWVMSEDMQILTAGEIDGLWLKNNLLEYKKLYRKRFNENLKLASQDLANALPLSQEQAEYLLRYNGLDIVKEIASDLGQTRLLKKWLRELDYATYEIKKGEKGNGTN